MSTNINREPMEIGETVVTHKCIGTQSSKISLFDLQQEKTFESNSLSNRKHHCTTCICTTCIENTTASCKNGEGVLDWGEGGDREQNVPKVSVKAPDYNYYRKPSKYFGCGKN